MSALKIGSKGREVESLQQNLKSAGFFRFEIDGDFGPQTETSVKQFQKAAKIKADGIAGPTTLSQLQNWKSRNSSKTTTNISANKKPLALRCLELTATIETGELPPHCFAGVSGNFDKMAVSFGALQWNFGMKSLQPILNELITKKPQVVKKVFGDHYEVLTKLLKEPHDELMKYFSSIQVENKNLWLVWKEQFKNLGYTKECVDAQLKEANAKYQTALNMCADYGLYTENAVALMFDIVVQNGSIKSATRTAILQDFVSAKNETEKLVIVARRRSADSKPEWQKDVLARKETIAKGFGKIHGKNLNLETDFGIRSVEAADLKSPKSKVA
ncbi:peptidoglycan-binding protein [bacterium]|nr:peptidoglycan-binding protein [bacterium]